jgi:hypothetical protein
LEKAAAQLDITLVYKAIAGSAEGYSKGGLIEIEEPPGLQEADSVGSL